MFSAFFALLRAQGVDVSPVEWLTLMHALDQGLAKSSLLRFYGLCRVTLVKREKDFDKFDRAFLEFFKEIRDGGALPDYLKDWLESSGDAPVNEQAGHAFSDEEIRAMLRERLKEQRGEHHGGGHWIGTDGYSPFGNSGDSDRGILVEGSSRLHRALEVAGERKYRDFREDKVLEARNFQVALRRLRQLSANNDTAKTEFDVDLSIHKTAAQGGLFHPVFSRPRKNTVKLLLLIDSGGSMDVYNKLCAELIHAVHRSNHFQDLKMFYFHNCVKGYIYPTPKLAREEQIETSRILDGLNANYKIILVGDALMDPGELTDRYFYRPGEKRSALELLRQMSRRYQKLVWLTPQDISFWDNKPWGGKSIRMIREIVPFRQLTPQGLESALKLLIKA